MTPNESGATETPTIQRLVDHPRSPAVVEQIERIFFEASGRAFVPGPERDAFRERWLGRFIEHFPGELFVACDAAGNAIGYLAGCLTDPSRLAPFSDLSYFRDLAALCHHYPAHLHINLVPEWRERGHGERLIEAFARHATIAGAPGMHVVTGKGLRNVRFYLKCGFTELVELPWNGRTIVMLGRRLR